MIFHVRRFADWDMFMHYHGGGIGHTSTCWAENKLLGDIRVVDDVEGWEAPTGQLQLNKEDSDNDYDELSYFFSDDEDEFEVGGGQRVTGDAGEVDW